MSEFENLAKTLAVEVITDVRTSLGESFASLTTEQKDGLHWAASKFLELQLRAKAGEDVEDKLQAVTSTIQDWEAWGEIDARQALWEGVQKVAETLGSFLANLALKQIGL